VLAGVIGAIALAGCGSSKPSKADYVKKANAVCAVEKQQMNELALHPGTLEQAIREALKIRRRTHDKLRAIKLPSSHGTPSEWLAYRSQAIRAISDLLETRPRSAARRASNARYFQANLRAERIARSYGLTGCSGFAAS
jgi:hypothetical protein